MVGLRARRSLCQKPLSNGKDKLAGATPTESSGTPIQAPAIARSPTPYSIEIARTRARSSPCQNPSPVKRGNDKPTEQALGALIDSSGFCALTFIPPCAHSFLRFSLQ